VDTFEQFLIRPLMSSADLTARSLLDGGAKRSCAPNKWVRGGKLD